MTLHVALNHRTSYTYPKLVALGPQTIRLRPAPHARTPIVSYSMKITPEPHFLNWLQDPQGNMLARVVFPEKVKHFEVEVDLIADMATINPFDFFLEPEAETFPFTYDPVIENELAPFRRLDPVGPELAALIAEKPYASESGELRTIDMLVDINRRIQERIAYIVRMEPGVWSPEKTLGEGKGSCRDSAWLLVQMLRNMGFAARFVSGYLIQLVADIKPLTGPAGPTADFTDLHAWAEVYLPGAGWIGFDATSGLMTGEGHIPLAASPDPSSAAPITGLVEPSEVEFGFDMKVTRVLETPRVTKPYGEKQWQDILSMGSKVDRALERADVRLTMGGEPTFVSVTDLDSPEWTIDALGPTKRNLAGRLIRRLIARWCPGAMLHHAVGKHYPGEQLPRWALGAHWRRDGQPIWNDPSLLASDDDRDMGNRGGAGGATAEDARYFAQSLAEHLGVDPDLIIPAYEDVHYYLWREKKLPANVLAEDAKLRDPLERARLARIYGQGLASEAGSVLPLRRVGLGEQRFWQSCKWFFREGELFLIPGDSPIGLRLPLESLPWVDDKNREIEVEPDPFDTPRKLSPAHSFRAGPQASLPTAPQELPQPGREEPDVVRTALTVEARNGLIHIFFPPLILADDWLGLVAAVEQTAASEGRKVVIEGYPPPRDPQLMTFSVTPDPGVIEVNIHPAHGWPDMVRRTEQLYEEARIVGLTSEKFMLDGRHVGTGGGNHVALGAATPNDSPFLRRPDLLKSMLGFWHNHPSLSFLFSGQFIGPTSQHPRVDEARQDMLGELEIAFDRVKRGKDVPPWLTDRLFRNILADMTGNTHRTEFCIDKLYAPESATGRLGLVEFRALEMPPHERMASAQFLLLRAAVAAFWEHPYERKLVRWGTRVHDEFMLPYFAEQDFRGVLEELALLGYRLDPAWFAPHYEFRFPRIGTVSLRGAEIELRHALEPWHVLGEEPAAGGTARYVDSSTERVQVRVDGWVAERYILACNGHAVPLTATERAGEFVGGVRFKAWAPPSALHPSIKAQTPLTFDMYDRWTGRSLGGLTHHVSHPGGRSYETFPVNANEAEARRRARFFPFGHTPGPMPEPPLHASREHPRTLDLRRLG